MPRYEAPSVRPSGFTFPALLRQGLYNVTLAVANASGFTSPQTMATAKLIGNRLRPSDVDCVVSQFQSGEPVDLQDFLERMAETAAAYRAFAQAVDDVAELAVGNPGVIVSGATPGNVWTTGASPRRQWPS